MLIEASALFFRHPGAETDTLSDCGFTVAKGQLCTLAGVNGSGKSTLLTLLAGLFPPSSGFLRVAGHALPAGAAQLRGKVALVPQDPDLYILGSLVEEDLLLGLDPADAAGRERALDIARTFGLGDSLHRPVHTLSYGQKRKLCLASALAMQPELLLLDEPFAGLDHPAATAVHEILLRNKAAGLTQLVASHDLELTTDITDSFILLAAGRVICAGDAATVFPRLLDFGVRPPLLYSPGLQR